MVIAVLEHAGIKANAAAGLSPELIKRIAAIEPTTPLGTETHKFLEDLAQRLLPKWDSKLEPISFLMLDEIRNINALFGQTLGEQFVGLTKRCFEPGLSNSLQSVDEIAAVVAHELAHYGYFKKYGTHENSSGEELSADLQAVRMLHDAGFSPFAMRTLLVERLGMSESSILDVHPVTATRVQAVEAYLFKLRTEEGSLETQVTPIPTDLPIRKLLHSEVRNSDFIEWSIATSYDDVPMVRKISTIGERLKNGELALTWEVVAELEALTKAAKYEVPRELDAIVSDIVLDSSGKLSTSLKVQILQQLQTDWARDPSGSTLRPLGIFNRLVQNFEEVSTSRNPEQQLAALERFGVIAETLSSILEPDFIKKVCGGSFGETLEFKRLACSTKLSETQALTLLRMGTVSENIISSLSLSDLEEVTKRLGATHNLKPFIRYPFCELSYVGDADQLLQCIANSPSFSKLSPKLQNLVIREIDSELNWEKLKHRSEGWHTDVLKELKIPSNKKILAIQIQQERDPQAKRNLSLLALKILLHEQEKLSSPLFKAIIASDTSALPAAERLACYATVHESHLTEKKKLSLLSELGIAVPTPSVTVKEILDTQSKLASANIESWKVDNILSRLFLKSTIEPLSSADVALLERRVDLPDEVRIKIGEAVLKGDLFNPQLLRKNLSTVPALDASPLLPVGVKASLLERLATQCREQLPAGQQLEELAMLLRTDTLIRNQPSFKMVAAEYARAFQQVYGIDDGSPVFAAEFERHFLQLLPVQNTTTYESRYSTVSIRNFQSRFFTAYCVEQGLQAVCAQRELATTMTSAAREITEKDLSSSTMLKILGESVLSIINSEGNGRAVANFLLVPLTPQSVHELSSRAGSSSAIDEATTLHRNFRELPLEIRTVLLRSILFHGASSEQTSEYLTKLKHFIFSRTPELRHSVEKYVNAYLHDMPTYEQEILLCAAAAANAGNDNSVSMSVGESLAMLLSALGPAEVKFGQALHSLPGTADTLSEGLIKLKYSSDIPDRVDLLEMIDMNVPAFVRQGMKVGKVLGAASFYISVEVRLADGQTGVLQILRPFAKERAEEGIKHLEGMLNCLDPEDPDRLLISRAIKSARKAWQDEIDGAIAVESIKLGKIEYTDEAAGSFCPGIMKLNGVELAGSGYRIIEYAPGVNLLQLSETSPALAKEKAKEIAVKELVRIFSGRRFDTDRHGGNIHIDLDGSVYHIDMGGLFSRNATAVEQKKLGTLIGTAAVYAFDEKLFLKKLTDGLHATRNSGQEEYCHAALRAFLALGDVLKLSGSRKDVGKAALERASPEFLASFNMGYAKESFKFPLAISRHYGKKCSEAIERVFDKVRKQTKSKHTERRIF